MTRLEAKFMALGLMLVLCGQVFPGVEDLRHQLLSMSLPLQFGVSRMAEVITTQLDFWVKLGSLAKENRTLRQDALRRESRLVECRIIEDENARLRELLGLGLSEGGRVVPAQVIRHSMSVDPYHLVINRGSLDGVEVGFPVISGLHFLGIIDVVESSISKVMLLTSPEFFTSAVSRGEEALVRGVVRGSASGKLLMEKILAEEGIASGDLIVTSDEEGYPPGLIIGRVERVIDRGVLKEALLDLDVNPSTFREVYVVKW